MATRFVRPKREAAALAFAMAFPLLAWLMGLVLLRPFGAEVQQAGLRIAVLLQFLFPWAWITRFGGERLHVEPPTQRWRGCIEGVMFALAVAAVMLALYPRVWESGRGEAAEIIATARTFGMTSPARFAANALFVCMVHSLLEEYYWRWFVFGRLRLLVPHSWAVLLASFAFMAHHVVILGVYFGWANPMTWACSICVAFGGMYWCLLYDRTRTLIAPWISHTVIDGAIFWIGYRVLRQTW